VSACVVAVCQRRGHHFSKTPQLEIRLVAGIGVVGDGHAGATVKHRSRVVANPHAPNLRQVHLLHAELFDDLPAFDLRPGDIGENITTRGIDLLRLPTGVRLAIGDAVIELTGLRNPCIQLDRFAPGLMAATLARDGDGRLVRKAGVMGVVVTGGTVRAGDAIAAELPAPPHRALAPV
jgi:MOSC domain-containing protein YiiM